MVLSGKYKSGKNSSSGLMRDLLFQKYILLILLDKGIHEMQIPEAIVYSIQNLPEEMQPHFFAGGNFFTQDLGSSLLRSSMSHSNRLCDVIVVPDLLLCLSGKVENLYQRMTI